MLVVGFCLLDFYIELVLPGFCWLLEREVAKSTGKLQGCEHRCVSSCPAPDGKGGDCYRMFKPSFKLRLIIFLRSQKTLNFVATLSLAKWDISFYFSLRYILSLTLSSSGHCPPSAPVLVFVLPFTTSSNRELLNSNSLT